MNIQRVQYRGGLEAVQYYGQNGPDIQAVWASCGGIEYGESGLWVHGMNVPVGSWIVRHPFNRVGFYTEKEFADQYEKSLVDHQLNQIYSAALALRDAARQSHYFRTQLDSLFRALNQVGK